MTNVLDGQGDVTVMEIFNEETLAWVATNIKTLRQLSEEDNCCLSYNLYFSFIIQFQIQSDKSLFFMENSSQ